MTITYLYNYLNLIFSLICLFFVLLYWYRFINFEFIGPDGNIGPIGNRGNMGPNGICGPDGIDIDRTFDTTLLNIYGPKGPPGLMGKDGPIGIQGKSGSQGPIGNMGNIGKIGETGIRGLKGAKGNPGILGEHVNKVIRLYTKYNDIDCKWTIDKECPDNNVISGVKFDPYLSYKCCPTRIYVL